MDSLADVLLENLLRRIGPAQTSLPRVDEAARLATYPPPYPASWYALGDAKDLARGDKRFVEALGEKLVVFRGEDGTLGVLDAYCPHLGANLAGGQVKGNCLECPFHRWAFTPDGQVDRIPYLEHVPKTLRTRSWAVREHHGLILVWFGSDEPRWDVDPIEEIEDGRMVYRGRYDAGSVHMHLCEFAENSADHQHFTPLHGEMMVPWTRLRIPGMRVVHEATWEPDPDQPHIAYFRDAAVLSVFGRVVQRTSAQATITFYGPGAVVAFRISVPDMGDILIFQTHLPLGPLEQHVRFRWFADAHVPRPLVAYVVGNWVSQWREDISIWENKVFRDKPMLVPGDGPMHTMRRWFRQFYA